MAKERVKLIDIASALNVSVGLVSLVLSGKGEESRISESLSKKVINKANELGYQANQVARGLRTGKSGIIGLIVADIANPFFGKMARYIENEASKLGYQVMFGSSDENPEKLMNITNVFLSRQVDGMIIVPVKNSTEHLLAMQKQSVPFVFIDRACKGVEEDTVCTDNYSGAFQLTNVLIGKGYKKIGALVNNTDLLNNRERIAGYISALKNAKLYDSKQELIFQVGFEQDETVLESSLNSILNNNCDALFFANNNLGISSLKLLDRMNIRIPADLGLASFDNPESFQIAKPGITCFEQPIKDICTLAFNTLSDKINNKSGNRIGRVLLPGNLIIRESC